MLLYKKIKTSFDNITFDEMYGSECFRVDGSFIEFQSSLTMKQLIIRIADRIKFNILPTDAKLTQIKYPGVPMHIDAWPVSLNYYFSTANGSTNFYRLKDEYDPAEDAGKRRSFDRTKYQVIDTFNPGKNELYLFNSSIPHDVVVSTSPDPRYVFRFIWSGSYQFDEIAESIVVLKDKD